VDAGIVYKTDASISKAVKVVSEVPAKEGPDISYPIAVIKESKNPEAAQKSSTISNRTSSDGVQKYGFIIQE
jgi:molybdate transport system substrate-binding protein